jgi:hypothetical protein
MSEYKQKSFKKEELELVLVEYLKRFGMSSVLMKYDEFNFMWNAHSDVMINWEEK